MIVRVGVSVLCCLSLVQFFFTAYAQQSGSSSLSPSLMQLQQSMSGQSGAMPSPETLQRLQKQYGSQLKSSTATADTSDTLETTDSLKSRQPNRSIYELMVRGETVSPEQALDSIQLFGHSVFNRARSASALALENMPVPSDYPIAPGDEIVVTLWGRINEENRIAVNRNGSVNVPRLGPISVAGLPFRSMQRTLVERLQRIEGVQASVSMASLQPVRVFVIGEVTTPGQYTISALSSPTNALFAAGGVSKRGSLRNIELLRNGKRIARLDFYDFLLKGQNFGNFRLQSGDVLIAPVVGAMAAIAGNVRRSALYELQHETSLAELVNLAGGFTPAAWTNRIQIERFENNRHQVVLDFQIDSSETIPDIPVQDGDIVKVYPIKLRDYNAVYLEGNVLRPGKYEFRDGMKVSDLLAGYEQLLAETYFNYAVIRRRMLPSYDEHIISFNLREALDNPQSEENLALEAQDVLTIYDKNFFEPDRQVTVQGAVTSPGEFTLLSDMRIKDLILQAGGLSEEASAERGELYRRIVDMDTVRTQKIPFCIECAMNDDPRHNMTLQKQDRVFIRKKRGWQETRRVALIGEFVFPGEYVLLEGETLDQLIERAGGFTSEAYLRSAVFSRISVKKMERDRNNEYVRQLKSDMARLSMEMASKEKTAEAQYLLTQQMALIQRLEQTEPVGRVVIDLEDPDSYHGFTLEDGDTLLAPKQIGTVSVMGQVFNPATMIYDKRKSSVKQYISLAGGLKDNADKRQIYVIRANGSVLSNDRRNIFRYSLEPGDVVIVPEKIRYTSAHRVFMDTIDSIYKIASAAGVVATLFAISRQNDGG